MPRKPNRYVYGSYPEDIQDAIGDAMIEAQRTRFLISEKELRGQKRQAAQLKEKLEELDAVVECMKANIDRVSSGDELRRLCSLRAANPRVNVRNLKRALLR